MHFHLTFSNRIAPAFPIRFIYDCISNRWETRDEPKKKLTLFSMWDFLVYSYYYTHRTSATYYREQNNHVSSQCNVFPYTYLGRYFCDDSNGNRLGYFKKTFLVWRGTPGVSRRNYFIFIFFFDVVVEGEEGIIAFSQLLWKEWNK